MNFTHKDGEAFGEDGGRTERGQAAVSGRFEHVGFAEEIDSASAGSDPVRHLKCGHVQGHHHWGKEGGEDRTCPICLKVGPVSQLSMGLEPAFWVDREPPTYAFNPCGHMASEKTVK